MASPIINVADVELQPRPPALAPTGAAAERFEARMGIIGAAIGAKALGYNVTEVPAGKSAFPFHNHHVNEEMFFVLDGDGQIRIGDAAFPIGPGDIVACPAGGAETAHQITNTGTVPLRYLAVSTRMSPEVAEYPDSGKFGVLLEHAPAADGSPRAFRYVGRPEKSLDYWEGES